MTTLDAMTLHAYIEEESDSLMLRIRDDIQEDGFHRALPGEDAPTETLMIKILSRTLIHTLAMMCEKTGHPNIALAYQQLMPMHTDFIKDLILRDIKRRSEL